jgi:hypothetical protein
MTDRLEKNEMDQLRDDVQRLQDEVDRLNAGPPPQNRKSSWWARIFGRRVYDGPKTCGHCKYWKEPQFAQQGDCKLLYGNYNSRADDSCSRFAPRRRYMHRVRT